ncbi:MAG: hypothetical protein IKF38_05865 [Clostridia bacterium]|nr:hypothetical protein [Clostridia bacterium]
MKKLKVLIITLIISGIIIGLALYFINMQKNNETSDNTTESDDSDYEIIYREPDTNQVPGGENYFKKISNNTYFAICNCIAANTGNSCIIIDVKSIVVDKVNSYTVNAIKINDNYEYLENKFYIVYLDYGNSTYLIEDVTDRYNNFDDIQVKEIDNIEDNGKNKYGQKNYQEEYKYYYIFQHMKRLMLSRPDIAYEYLDKNYKNERFGSYDKFLEYVQNNREHLITISVMKYIANDDKTQIILQDQYSNRYEFNVTDTMKYTSKIDNYIVMNKSDIEQYKKYAAEKKVKYNVNRWIKMINSKDYEIAYKYLDETFKKNNYPTVEEFAKFMDAKFTNWYNNVEINLEQEGNTYIAKVEMSVEGQEFTDKYLTIFMQLGADTDFTMSFNEK